MTIGERIDNTLADSLVAAGRGIRFGLAIAAKIGDRLLGGSSFNEREAQRFLYEEALNKAEEQVDSLDPWYADGGPTEWLDPERTMLWCGVHQQNVELCVESCENRRYYLSETTPGRAQHPLYRDIQVRHDEAMERLHDAEYQLLQAHRELNTLPKWQPHTSAPAQPSPKPADAADSPEAVHPPSGAASGSSTCIHGGDPAKCFVADEQPVGVGEAGPGADGTIRLLRNRTEHIRRFCTAAQGRYQLGSNAWWVANSVLNILNGNVDDQDAFSK